MADDFSANARTTGTVEVGGSATGEIGKRNDVDWFAVELVAGQTYVIDLEGAPTGGGTLGDAMLRGLYDAGGNRIAGTRDRDGGEGANARLTFIATESGTHYIAARSQGGDTGSYTVRVTAFDADATAAGATDLGDLAALDRTRTQQDTVDGGADGTDYYRFTLSEARQVQFTLRRQDADADLYLEDADGTVLHSSTRGGTRNDGINELLEAGTYYVRVVAQEEGENAYKLRYRAAEPEPDPQPQQGAPQQQQAVVPTNVPEPEGQDFADNTSTQGRVLVDGSVTGNIHHWSDTDWFAVELEAGKAYRIELKGASTGDGTLDDPEMRGIYDSNGRFLTYGDDDEGAGWNSMAFFTPDADGTYYVSAWGAGPAVGTYTLSVTDVLGTEDDFTADTGTTGGVAVGGSADGNIGGPNDIDWFAVTLEAGKTYQIDMVGFPGVVLASQLGTGRLGDPALLGIYDQDGNHIDDSMVVNDGGEGYNSRAFFTATEDATYYVAAGTSTGPGERARYQTGDYTVSVKEVVDDYAGDTSTTGKIAVGGSVRANAETPGDRDWFAIELEAGKDYRFAMEGIQYEGQGSLHEMWMRGGLYDADGNRITGSPMRELNGNVFDPVQFLGRVPNLSSSDGAAGCGSGASHEAGFRYTPTESGTYYVAAGSWDGHIFGTGSYTLLVGEGEDSL